MCLKPTLHFFYKICNYIFLKLYLITGISKWVKVNVLDFKENSDYAKNRLLLSETLSQEKLREFRKFFDFQANSRKPIAKHGVEPYTWKKFHPPCETLKCCQSLKWLKLQNWIQTNMTSLASSNYFIVNIIQWHFQRLL